MHDPALPDRLRHARRRRKLRGMTADYRLDGRVAVVTGGASGIGQACGRLLARSGADVVVADVSLAVAQRVSDDLGDATGRVTYVATDVSDPASVAELGRFIVAEFGRLDLAVNSAGIGVPPRNVEQYDLDDWRRVLSVNLDGVLLAMRMEIPLLRNAGRGSIVNIGSILGQRGRVGVAAYVASKHAVVGLTRAAALETAADGIRINVVSPGFILTPLVAQRHDNAARADLAALHPVERMGTPDEVAECVMWLLSDASSFVTGADYGVDGGFLAR